MLLHQIDACSTCLNQDDYKMLKYPLLIIKICLYQEEEIIQYPSAFSTIFHKSFCVRIKLCFGKGIQTRAVSSIGFIHAVTLLVPISNWVSLNYEIYMNTSKFYCGLIIILGSVIIIYTKQIWLNKFDKLHAIFVVMFMLAFIKCIELHIQILTKQHALSLARLGF